jgi:hypothetical protein
MNVGIVLCERKSFLNIQVLFNKNLSKKKNLPHFHMESKNGVVCHQWQLKNFYLNVDGIKLNS